MRALLVLARRQAGVVGRAQWLAAGVSDGAVATLVRRGFWVRLHQGVHAGPLGHESRCVAAVLAIGGEVELARESALWWRDRERPAPRRVHVGVRRERSVGPLPGVVVGYDVRGLVDPARIPNVASVEDATLDIAARAGTALAVEVAVCDVVGGRLTHPTRLADALAGRARHRHRGLLTAMLTEVEAGARSPLELLDLRNDLRHGIPVADRQVRQRVGGQGRWLDAVYGGPGLRRSVQKELDGRLGHEGARGRFRDSGRDNVAALLGRAQLRQGWHDLADEGCRSAGDTLHVLRLEGYTGSGRPCGPACELPSRLIELAALLAG